MFWDELGDRDRRAIEAAAVRRRFDAGSEIFVEGATASYVMILLRGRVTLTVVSATGKRLLLEIQGLHSLIGELGVVDREPRSATVTALDDVDALVVASTKFDHLIQSRPSVSSAVLATVTARVRQSDDRRLEASAADALTRLCSRLVELSDGRSPTPEGWVDIDVPLSQQDLADWIGASRDAVVLALRELRQQSVIETGRQRIQIKDVETLRRLAQA